MKQLSELLEIEHPILLAPMFMVTNAKMVAAAVEAGATGALTAHNYRNSKSLQEDIQKLKAQNIRPFGVNIVLDFANENFHSNLEVCLKEKVDFVMTSLGDPQAVITKCKPAGIQVFCDVTNQRHAAKAVSRGADALIAVNKDAGGHAGTKSASDLVPELVSAFEVPIISAGGVATHEHLQNVLNLGAAGASVGSVFIATHESDVSEDYKQAVVQGNKHDVILTRRISGVPMTVIHTNYIQQIGTKRTRIEQIMKRHRKTRRLLRKLMERCNMSRYQHYITGPDYQRIYCAGQSIDHIHKIESVKTIVKRIAGVD